MSQYYLVANQSIEQLKSMLLESCKKLISQFTIIQKKVVQYFDMRYFAYRLDLFFFCKHTYLNHLNNLRVYYGAFNFALIECTYILYTYVQNTSKSTCENKNLVGTLSNSPLQGF